MSEYTLNPDHKSFVMFYDQREMIESMSDEQAGQLLKFAMMMESDLDPIILDPVVKVLFLQIKRRVVENDKKWTGGSKQAAAAQQKRWLKENKAKFDSGVMSEADYIADRDRRLTEIERLEGASE